MKSGAALAGATGSENMRRVTLRGVNDRVFCVEQMGEDNVGALNARTDPKRVGPWERLEEENLGGDEVALSILGSDNIRRYVSGQPDGTVQVNRVKAADDLPDYVPSILRYAVGGWERWHKRRAGNGYSYQNAAHGTFLCVDLGLPVTSADGQQGHRVVCNRTVQGPWEVIREGTGNAKYKLEGRAYVKDGQFHDANGPCHFFFHHDMPHLRVADENPSEADAACDALAAVGSGNRLLWRVADDFDVPCKPGDYWYGRSVSRDCMRRQLAAALDRHADRGLKVILSMGALSKNDNEEIGLHEEAIDIVVRSGHHCLSGGRATVALAEHRNEPNMTSQYRWDDREKAWALAKRVMQMWRERVGCIVTGGSWGDNDQMLAASDGMDALDYHEDRSMPECIHHIHTAWNEWMFHRKAGGKALYGGERPGPNYPYPENTNLHPDASLGGDMYVGCDDPELAWGVAAQAHFTGQGTAWLNGPGVRHRVAIDSTVYYGSLIELVHTHIWKDAGLWRGPNPTWRTPGGFDSPDRRFMYAGLAEWNQTGHPPFKVGKWKAIGPAGVTDEGEGPIAIRGSWKFRLIVGERA